MNMDFNSNNFELAGITNGRPIVKFNYDIGEVISIVDKSSLGFTPLSRTCSSDFLEIARFDGHPSVVFELCDIHPQEKAHRV